jgi:tryptophan synthase alpha chain
MSSRLETTFDNLRQKGQKALIAYLMAVLALEGAGADIIELGVPFSDPIADGPVIQQAAERALKSGTSLRKILDSVKSLRQRTDIPIVLMLYYNSIHAMGCAEFCKAAKAAGVDGLIVPDMPPDEAGPLRAPADEAGLSLIFLLAPTSTGDRRKLVAKESHGFVYYVSLTGITGAKLSNVEDVQHNVAKLKKVSGSPVAVGFGVATPEDAARVSKVADGVIVGSAIVKRIASHQQDPAMIGHVAEFVRSLKVAMMPA